jgi:hypothetical protein
LQGRLPWPTSPTSITSTSKRLTAWNRPCCSPSLAAASRSVYSAQRSMISAERFRSGSCRRTARPVLSCAPWRTGARLARQSRGLAIERLVRLTRCTLCPDSDQILQRSEMSRWGHVRTAPRVGKENFHVFSGLVGSFVQPSCSTQLAIVCFASGDQPRSGTLVAIICLVGGLPRSAVARHSRKGGTFFGSVSSLSRYRPETEPSSDANGPDTERQDQLSPNHHFRLATRGRSIQQEETSAPTDMPSPLAFSAHHFLATAWEASIGSDEWKSRQLSVLSSTWSSRRQRDRLVLPC